jgi:4-hydroxythreonine-4-phosphate dehydrogenase
LFEAAERAGIRPFWFRVDRERAGRIDTGVVVADFDEYAECRWGGARPSERAGRASLHFFEEAIEAARTGVIDAIVTAPIHKTSWRMAGVRVPGHTEYLANAFNAKRVTMMFTGGGFRIALASIHIGLFELRNRFTIGLVFQPIDLLHDALVRSFGIAQPRIAVAALNPHAGEDGQFSDEEGRIIEPAILAAREVGIEVEGPFPADTLFWMARGKYDGVVAMYHDQGLIPIKMAAFDSSVNITLGLPVIRTSVDHGTAFDIVGRNGANPGSMKAAITQACQMAAAQANQPVPDPR